AQEIMLQQRNPKTPLGIVSGATRDHELVCLTTLEKMLDQDQNIGMQTTVIIGNSATFVFGDKMITPRGYSAKYGLAGKEK
ncbi:MAG: precorrin-3B C(17)-methyltransferase, partial [Candidatus Electrothrix sp. AUS3]|nr:precorrin-3B C(17)-methyltransferase [Candidatus Electrothrix gigas]